MMELGKGLGKGQKGFRSTSTAMRSRSRAPKWSPIPVPTQLTAAELQWTDRYSSHHATINESPETKKKVIPRGSSLARART